MRIDCEVIDVGESGGDDTEDPDPLLGHEALLLKS